MMGAPLERLHVWNLGRVDDALAVTLLYMHCVRPYGSGEVTVFHSGPPPGWDPIGFRHADVRPVAGSGWITRSKPPNRGWELHPRVLDRILLVGPTGPVDLISAGGGRPPLEKLRVGGHLLSTEPLQMDPALSGQLRRVDDAGHLYRKVGGPTIPDSVDGVSPGARTLRQHDCEARLVSSYMNLARNLARRFEHKGERPEDLEQVAAIALVRAAGRYSPERGPFGPFAAASILGELKRHLRDKLLMVRVPRTAQERYLEIRAARDELCQTLGASPTITQIAEHLGTTDEVVLASMEAAENSWPTSLDARRPGGDDPVTEIPVTEAGFDQALDHRILSEALPRLSPTERLVVRRVYFDGCSQKQVAAEIGVSQMQISRIVAKTLAQLRSAFEPA